MPKLNIKPKRDCAWDLVSLGEVMLRLDPGDERISTTRHFRAWEGGGEYNVARGLRRCFGERTAIVTALADNDVGWLIEDLILQGGVDCSFVQFVPFDGVGRSVRNGLNFTERGFGVRGARGVSDRGHTAASQLAPEAVDWDHLFGDLGVRWFHTGGIYAALSGTTPDVIEAAMAAAHRHGTIVSYDLNYRPSLWQSAGGRAAAGPARLRFVRGASWKSLTVRRSAAFRLQRPPTAEDLAEEWRSLPRRGTLQPKGCAPGRCQRGLKSHRFLRLAVKGIM